MSSSLSGDFELELFDLSELLDLLLALEDGLEFFLSEGSFLSDDTFCSTFGGAAKFGWLGFFYIF